jgi:hypothetical protein
MKRSMFRLFVLFFVWMIASAFRVSWSPVTTYTDNTSIEPTKTIMYDVWMDNVPLAIGTTQTFAPLTDNTHGAWHSYKARTRLSSGEVSDNSALVTLQSPLGVPNLPAAGWSIGN